MSVLTRAARHNIPEDDILLSPRRENLKSYILLTAWSLERRRNVSPVKYELGFYIPEDAILHSHCRENLKSYIPLTGWALKRRRNLSPVKYKLGVYIPEDDIFHSPCHENLKCYIFRKTLPLMSLSENANKSCSQIVMPFSEYLMRDGVQQTRSPSQSMHCQSIWSKGNVRN
jgi:hypothetical protein